MTYDAEGPPTLRPEYMPNRNRLTDSAEGWGGGMPASLIFNVHNYKHLSQGFFAYSALNINFKGVHMKLKIVGLEISVE